MIQEQSYSIQHEQRTKLRGAQSRTELRVICAYRRSVTSRSPSMWSLADSSETIMKRRNNDNNIGNHERSEPRTWRLYCTLLHNGSNDTKLLGATALNCAVPAVARCTQQPVLQVAPARTLNHSEFWLQKVSVRFARCSEKTGLIYFPT